MTFDAPELNELDQEVRKLGRISSALSVLGWDQQTYMPAGGASSRGDVLGELTKLSHEMGTSSELGDKISKAEASLNGDGAAAAYVREVRRGYDKKVKVPAKLAEDIARTCSVALQDWKKARAEDDFNIFKPSLTRLVELVREKAQLTGETEEIYDALLDTYEPRMSTAEATALCDAVRPVLVDLVKRVTPIAAKNDTSFLHGHSREMQEEFSQAIIAQLGFDFNCGRVDVSAHPFCSGFAPDDVRLTTRYEDCISSALFGLIHEAGHGLYEQGLPVEWSGTPLASAISMGIHESQSRLWENNIGRSHQFWQWALPQLAQHAPQVQGVSIDDFVRAVNHVQPSLIRVEADEVTYSLHIMLRFEIERDLMGGKVSVDDLPELWNTKMVEYLGVKPESDANGVLQDVHWSFGGFGYFPTYFLGNLYAAQFLESAEQAEPELWSQVARGEFAPLLNWLRENIHRHGRRYTAGELCEKVTGRALSEKPFVDYLTGKMQHIYGV